MKAPRKFFEPLAIGAPAPLRELPARLERMIHFVPPHNEKVRAKVGELVVARSTSCSAISRTRSRSKPRRPRAKVSSRWRRRVDFGATGLWVRVNALNSPWLIDDLTRIVGEVGDKLDVVMVPKVEGPWDIHFIDQYLALLEARHKLRKPILVHAILETAQGVNNVAAIAAASPRMQGMSLGPADLAASRAMKTTRVGGGHPDYRVLGDARAGARTSAQQDPWHYTIARMVDACAANGLKAFYGPFGDFSDPEACEAQFRNAFLLGCAGAWTPASEPDRHRQAGVLARSRRGRVRHEDSRGDAGRLRRGDDRRQDAGRRDLETGAGDRRSRAPGGGQGQGFRRGLRVLSGGAATPLQIDSRAGAALRDAPSNASRRSAKVRHRPGGQAPHLSVSRRDLRRRSRVRQHRGMVHARSPPKSGRPRTSRSTICSPRTRRPQYIAYVSEQNLLPDDSGQPVRHPQVEQMFMPGGRGFYRRKVNSAN